MCTRNLPSSFWEPYFSIGFPRNQIEWLCPPLYPFTKLAPWLTATHHLAARLIANHPTIPTNPAKQRQRPVPGSLWIPSTFRTTTRMKRLKRTQHEGSWCLKKTELFTYRGLKNFRLVWNSVWIMPCLSSGFCSLLSWLKEMISGNGLVQPFLANDGFQPFSGWNSNERFASFRLILGLILLTFG